MKIAVLGASGMLGTEFCALLTAQGQDYFGFGRNLLNASMSRIELEYLLRGFDVVVNCLAYTAVDLAETNRDEAMLANGDFVGELAAAAKATGAHVYHFSTDYVFSGMSREPYLPAADRSPLSIYGLTKAKGEEYLEESGAKFTILRTAWLYGQFGKSFPRTISTLLMTKDSVSIVADQFGQPTWTRDVSQLTLKLILEKTRLTHVHATSSGQTSWYGFGLQIAANLGETFVEKVHPIDSASYPTPAIRPRFSVLANDQLNESLRIRAWDEAWLEARTTFGPL